MLQCGSLLPSTIVPVSTSCPLALHSLLVLHLRSLPASFHRSSACHFIRRAPVSYFSSFQLGCLLQPSLHPTFCVMLLFHPSPRLVEVLPYCGHDTLLCFCALCQFYCCCFNLTLAATKTAHTGITPQEQGRGKDNTSAVEFSTVCTVSCVCARLFFSSVSSLSP